MKKILKLTFLAVIVSVISPVSTNAYNYDEILSNSDGFDEIIIMEDDDLLNPSASSPIVAYEQPVQPVQQLPQVTSTEQVAHIVVHRVSNTCVVYDKNGQVVNAFIVSTGRKGHNTPLGTYKIYEHSTGNGYHLMVDGTYGKWCMRFKQGGYMFHSVCYARAGDAYPIAQEVADLGTSVSRGCVRLSVVDAEWLYRNTPNGCKVSILND